MRRWHRQEAIEFVIGLGGVGAKGAVFQVLATVSNPYTPSQMVADFRSEDAVATVDGALLQILAIPANFAL